MLKWLQQLTDVTMASLISSDFDTLSTLYPNLHKIVCCQVIEQVTPNNEFQDNERKLRGEIAYFVERRCGIGGICGDGGIYPDTNDMEEGEDLDPDYCWCVFKVETTKIHRSVEASDLTKVADVDAMESGIIEAHTMEDNAEILVSVKEHFYAVYKSKFYYYRRNPRPDGWMGGIVKEIPEKKFSKSVNLQVAVSNSGEPGGVVTKPRKRKELEDTYVLDDETDETGASFNPNTVISRSTDLSEAGRATEKDPYRLILVQEADFRCNAHKDLSFKVELYQWGKISDGRTPNHISKRKGSHLKDVLREPLDREYINGEEVRLENKPRVVML